MAYDMPSHARAAQRRAAHPLFSASVLTKPSSASANASTPSFARPTACFLTSARRCAAAASSKAPAPAARAPEHVRARERTQLGPRGRACSFATQTRRRPHVRKQAAAAPPHHIHSQGREPGMHGSAQGGGAGAPGTTALSSMTFFTARRPSRTASLICAMVWSLGPWGARGRGRRRREEVVNPKMRERLTSSVQRYEPPATRASARCASGRLGACLLCCRQRRTP